MVYEVIRWFEKHPSVMCFGELNQEETERQSPIQKKKQFGKSSVEVPKIRVPKPAEWPCGAG